MAKPPAASTRQPPPAEAETAAVPEAKGQLVNREQMATIMGVAKTTLDDWVKRGCPVHRPSRTRGVPAQFDTAAVMAWRQQDQAGGEDGHSADKEKARLNHWQAELAELRFRREVGELVPLAEVRTMREAENIVMRDRLRSIPLAIADRLIDAVKTGAAAPAVAAIMLREIDDALVAIADAEVTVAAPAHDALGDDSGTLPGDEGDA